MEQLKLFEEQDLSKKQDDVLSDILLVFNEKEKKISAVRGIDENGNLKTIEPTAENEGAFMKVDKNANAFSNFFSNFFRQLTNPTGLHFFKSDTKDAEQNARTIEAAIISNDPQKKKEIVDKYYIKPEQPEQAEKVGLAAKPTEPEQQKRQTYYDRNEVNFKSLEHFGITEKMLEDSGQMDALLNRKLTTLTYNAHGKFNGAPIDFDAAVQIGRDSETNQLVAMALGTKKEPDFDRGFFGHDFTPEDQENLLKTGNMGRVAHLVDYKTGVVEPHFISLDPLTNRFFARKVASFEKLEIISKVKLTPEIKQKLIEGKAVNIPGMINQKGKPITCPVQLSGHPNKYVDYLHSQGMKQEVNEKGERVFRGEQIKGVLITPKDVETLNNKGVLHLKDMASDEGGKFSSYVYWDAKNGVLKFPKNNPYKSAQKDLKEQTSPKQGVEKKSVKNEAAGEDKEKAVKKPSRKIH